MQGPWKGRGGQSTDRDQRTILAKSLAGQGWVGSHGSLHARCPYLKEGRSPVTHPAHTCGGKQHTHRGPRVESCAATAPSGRRGRAPGSSPSGSAAWLCVTPGTSLAFLELQFLPVTLIIAQKKSNFYLYTL